MKALITLALQNGEKSMISIEQSPKVKNKQNSAAAVSGNAPQAIEPEERETDDFWKGIMEFNNTNT